jgi:hypothetical protein
MTAARDIDWPQVLAQRLATTHPDVLRELLATFIHTVMGAEADAVCVCARVTVSAAPSAPITATATGIANSTPSDLTLPQGETSRFAHEAR